VNFNEFSELFGNCTLDGDKILINKEKLHDAVVFASTEYSYTMLKEIIAVQAEDKIELIYHLYSITDEESLKLSILVQDEAQTVTDIFKSAVADENEIYDLFGVKFVDNKQLKRLYMPESWEGHPLRKDYVQDDTRLAWNDDNNV
jgi:NADH-quinone oxidoreductase subunit C